MTDVFHPGLVAYIRRLAYDYDTKTAQLWLAPNQATSMTGAIVLVQSLDAEVHTIETFVDDAPSTRYTRDEQGEWTANEPLGERADDQVADVPLGDVG